jgi:hypothetical protein
MEIHWPRQVRPDSAISAHLKLALTMRMADVDGQAMFYLPESETACGGPDLRNVLKRAIRQQGTGRLAQQQALTASSHAPRSSGRSSA